MLSGRRTVFVFLAMSLAALMVFVTAGFAFADPLADLTVSQIDTPDPVVGANTVQYKVTVKNNGPTASDELMLSEYAYFYETGSEGTIYPDVTVLGGPGWTCGDSEGVYCTHAGLAMGETAVLFFDVLAPVLEGTIYHYVDVWSNTTDPDPYNNNDTEATDVVLDSSCSSSSVSCGSGHINYGSFSYVSTGFVPDADQWFVGTTTFKPVTGATGGQVWSMRAPKDPQRLCPTNLISLGLFKCTFQMTLDPIPTAYPVGNTTFTGICHRSHCKPGVIPGLRLVMVEVGANNVAHILPRCVDGITPVAVCYKVAKTMAGDLKVTVMNLSSGDPKIAGLCLGGGC